MMRIIIAGGAGLGYLIAKALSESQYPYSIIVLSRYDRRSSYAEMPNVQVVVINYEDFEGLRYTLQGSDLVISTVSGQEQLNLINAAGHAGVSKFVPAEFEGSLERRSRHDSLDRQSSSKRARDLLQDWANSRDSALTYTIFSCGILMENFQQEGLAALGVGNRSMQSVPGSYMLNLVDMKAEVVEKNTRNHSVRLCLTSIYDVAQLVAKAVELGIGNWPAEFTMFGDKMTVRDMVQACTDHFGVAMTKMTHQVTHLNDFIDQYKDVDNAYMAARYQRLLATANGRYYFGQPTLNDALNRHHLLLQRPLTFTEWLNTYYPQSYPVTYA